MKRRIFLISALALAVPARATPVHLWQGHGLGGALSLRLEGSATEIALLAPRLQAEIDRVEAVASLHRESELVRLNRTGRIAWPSADLLELLDLSDRVHRATLGAFDPTVQPLWQALATGADTATARRAIGGERARFDTQEGRLDRDQALTLNGIAQGWAADRIAALLQAKGYKALIDMGEFRALGGPWPVTAEGPGLSVPKMLRQTALAVSSPMGTRIGPGLPHILGPQGQSPLWQTVAVTAPQAALADALSTAFCLMPRPAIAAALQDFPGTDAQFA